MHEPVATWEAYALRHGSLDSNKATEYYRYSFYGEPDEEEVVAYYFWVLRQGERVVLVDCGYDRDRARARGRTQHRAPADLLVALGVTVEQVEHVVLTHMHYDHIGNVGHFPNATFSIGRVEYEFFTGPMGAKPLLGSAVEPAEVAALTALAAEGRLRLLDDGDEPLPGVVVRLLDGHTPGELIVYVPVAEGTVVLASDAIHYFEEYERDRPFFVFTDLVATYRSFEIVRELHARPQTWVVPGHDPLVLKRFATVDPDIADLTRPLP